MRDVDVEYGIMTDATSTMKWVFRGSAAGWTPEVAPVWLVDAGAGTDLQSQAEL